MGRPEVTERVASFLLTTNDARGRNCLHLACLYGASKLVEEICDEFVQFKVSLHLTDSFGYTAMELACISYDETQRGNQASSGTQNPVTSKNSHRTSVTSPRLQIIKYLVEKQKMKWNYDTYYHRTNPLHWALVNGDAELAYYLVRHAPGLSKPLDYR